MDGFIDHIKDKWLEWESIIYATLILLTLFATLASIPALQHLSLTLALVFVMILAVYSIFCAIHERKERINASKEANGKKLTRRFNVLFYTVIAVCVLAVISALFVLFYTSENGNKDGNYVIWSDEYRVALSPNVRNLYYLEGEKISLAKGQLNEYPNHCVFELDFEKDDTFTINYRDNYLGMTPGRNGIGYSDSCISTRWKLEEVYEGVYHIINVDENAYLKWYPEKDDWTTSETLLDKYFDQYLICIEKVD